MEFLFILLQAATTVEGDVVSEIVSEVLGYGLLGAFSIVVSIMYLRTRKENRENVKSQTQRLINDKEHLEEKLTQDRTNADTQLNMMWTELKMSKNEEIAKYGTLTTALNETQLQTVKALQENTAVIKENTAVMAKNMEILDKVIDVLSNKV